MKLDRSSIFAVVLCFLGYVGFEFYLNQKYPDRYKKPPVVEAIVSSKQVAENPETKPNPVISAAPIETYKEVSAEDLRIENDTSVYTFDQKKGSLVSITLKNFEGDNRSSDINLLEKPLEIYPLRPGETSAGKVVGFDVKREAKQLTFSRTEGPWLLSHTFVIDDKGYGANVTFSWKNTSSNAEDLRSVIFMKHEMIPQKKSSSFLPGMPSGHPFLIVTQSGSVERYDAINLCKEPGAKLVHSEQNQNLGVIGFDLHYFMNVLLPQNQRANYRILKNLGGEGQTCLFSFFLENEQGAIKPAEEVSISYKSWFGPKSMYVFGTYDTNLETTLDLGFFGKISHPLLSALHFLNDLVKNWGLAIIVLTFFLKFLFYPLTRQAAISMKRMSKLQPEMTKIREKFKDDPQRMQQEIMRFMSLHKVNPMKGCLPILPQIPVFFAFYRVLSTSLELRHAPFFGWIHDLSSADPYYITPLLLGVAMFFQQKLTPSSGLDKNQERIMMLLPIFFTVMMLTLPAGMVIYMLTNTIISIAQQQWLNRKLK